MRPNIVFAFADDWGRYASAYAEIEGAKSLNQLLHTPNFDRVAREGALFTNAFVQAPTCTPCRSSILAGQYFWQTGLGAILQGARWDETIPTYPLELEKAGYHIGHTYKVWSPGKTANAPYGATRTAYNPAGSKYAAFSQFVTAKSEKIGIEDAKQILYQETLDNFNAFLDARPQGKPFCYWWGPTNTHRKWEKGSGKALWGIEPDELEGRLPDFLPDVDEVREDVADYLGECMAVDGGLGIILKRLEEIGELDNTLVVVSGDHGIPGIPRGKCNLYDIGSEVAMAAMWKGHIEPGRIIDDCVSLMELGPTFLEASGVPVPESMTSTSITALLESNKSGQVEEHRDHVILGRERHVAGAREGFLPYPQRAIRTKKFLYIINFEPDRWPMGDPKGLDDYATESPPYEDIANDTFVAYADLDASPTKAWMIHHRGDEDVTRLFEAGFGRRPYEELYDIRIDPHHMNNVAGDPGLKSIKQSLRERLMTVLKEQRDPRIVETPCRFEHAPYAGPLVDW